jgi:uncharacterized protein YdeI (YjbR/CyaY-like superfamily)
VSGTKGDPRHFKSGKAFEQWLERNHADKAELWVGFYKKATGKGGITYPEALDAALCYGWIDGVRRRVDEAAYEIRFSPRKPVSKWSQVNVDRYSELEADGRIRDAGAAAWARFDPEKHRPYSFETRPKKLAPELERRFRDHAEAWTFFGAQPPGYRRTAIFWVMDAVRSSTRERRLDQLIDHSANGRRLPQAGG